MLLSCFDNCQLGVGDVWAVEMLIPCFASTKLWIKQDKQVVFLFIASSCTTCQTTALYNYFACLATRGLSIARISRLHFLPESAAEEKGVGGHKEYKPPRGTEFPNIELAGRNRC